MVSSAALGPAQPLPRSPCSKPMTIPSHLGRSYGICDHKVAGSPRLPQKLPRGQKANAELQSIKISQPQRRTLSQAPVLRIHTHTDHREHLLVILSPPGPSQGLVQNVPFLFRWLFRGPPGEQETPSANHRSSACRAKIRPRPRPQDNLPPEFHPEVSKGKVQIEKGLPALSQPLSSLQSPHIH